MSDAQFYFCEGLSPHDDFSAFIPPLEQLRSLLNQSAFWAKGRRLEDLETAIAHSHPVFSLWDQTQLIGFARATSDGIFRATIGDVVIHPQYRGMGLGRQLLEQLLAHPHMCQVERVYLMTTYQQKFYEKMGFAANSSDTMVRCQHSSPLLQAQQIQELESSLQV